MPIGTTSYFSRSMACSTLPAVTQEMRVLAGPAAEHDGDAWPVVSDGWARSPARPYRPRLARMPEDPPAAHTAPPSWQPATVAVTAGRPAHRPDQPLNTPITMASTYVAGGDLEYGRYGEPDLDRVRGRARARSRAGGA